HARDDEDHVSDQRLSPGDFDGGELLASCARDLAGAGPGRRRRRDDAMLRRWRCDRGSGGPGGAPATAIFSRILTAMMSRRRIVLWRPMYHPLGHSLLSEAGIEVIVVDSSDAGELKQSLHGASVLWARAPERVTDDVLGAGKSLIAVSSSGFGTDNIDIAA